MYPKKLAKLMGKHVRRILFLIKSQTVSLKKDTPGYEKDTPAQVLTCEFCQNISRAFSL